MASLIRTTPFLFTLVRFLGAIYLLFLGAKILYATFVQKAQAQQPQIEGGHSILRKSRTGSLTNQLILFYVSFFVQFIDFNYAHTGLSFTILALILEAVSFIYMSTLIFSRRDAGAFLQSQERLRRSSATASSACYSSASYPSGDPELVIPPGRRRRPRFPLRAANDTQGKPNVRQTKPPLFPLI
ncbi:LysE family transporter [Serratia ureilytica]